MSATGRCGKGVRTPVDRQASRTRKCIDDAFLSLLQRHGYDAVRVSDIVRNADVGRATFYEHYASKDDLLRAQLRRVLSTQLQERANDPGVFDATALFAHVRDTPLLYRLVAGRSASTRSLRIVQEALEERAGNVLLQRVVAGAPLPMPLTPPIATRVLAASLCSLLSWWTEDGMKATADEMQQLFRSCVGPMLAGPAAT